MQRRVKVIFSYDGTPFFGSQIQKDSNVPTVMGTFQKALKGLGISGIAQASGRTDKGVHALNQVCHIDIPFHFSNLEKLKNNLNRYLKPYIFIKHIIFVNLDFHSRFSAKKRLYRYIVSHSLYNPLQANYVIFTPRINTDSLNKNLNILKGRHNFKYFKKEGSNTKNDMRTIYNAHAYRYKNCTVIDFLGESFLRSQVRLMCNFIFEIERGRLKSEDLLAQLNLDKKILTSPAPAKALYLSRVYY